MDTNVERSAVTAKALIVTDKIQLGLSQCLTNNKELSVLSYNPMSQSNGYVDIAIGRLLEKIMQYLLCALVKITFGRDY